MTGSALKSLSRATASRTEGAGHRRTRHARAQALWRWKFPLLYGYPVVVPRPEYARRAIARARRVAGRTDAAARPASVPGPLDNTRPIAVRPDRAGSHAIRDTLAVRRRGAPAPGPHPTCARPPRRHRRNSHAIQKDALAVWPISLLARDPQTGSGTTNGRITPGRVRMDPPRRPRQCASSAVRTVPAASPNRCGCTAGYRNGVRPRRLSGT